MYYCFNPLNTKGVYILPVTKQPRTYNVLGKVKRPTGYET